MSTSMESLGLARPRTSVAGGLWATVRHAAGWPVRVHRARRLLHQLGALDDRELRDIGLTRLDLAAARELPLDGDPSRMLRSRVRERRRRG